MTTYDDARRIAALNHIYPEAKHWTTDPQQAWVYDYEGAPVCTHNHLCPTCQQHPAVFDLSNGRFLPCTPRPTRRSWLQRLTPWRR